MSDNRIYLDDGPAPERGGPWKFVVAAVLILAGATFAVGRPREDRAVVELPAPLSSTSTSTTTPATTTTAVRDLALEVLVPSFDRPLLMASIEPDGLTSTRWAPGAPPQQVEHTLGTVTWVGFDADAAILGATTATSAGQDVLWLGPWDALEPVIIEPGGLSAVFHSTRPGSIGVARAGEGTTTVTLYTVGAAHALTATESTTLDGHFRIAAWTVDGLLLVDTSTQMEAAWLTPTNTVESLTDVVIPPFSGAPLLFDGGIRGPVRALADGALIHAPEDARSISPSGRYVVIDEPLQTEMLDTLAETALPLADGLGFVADWSTDERWLVYVSDIESFRRGRLSRLVFVDAPVGSVVSVSVNEEQITPPHVIAVGG